MSPDQWTAVDRYITDRLLPPEPVLDAALLSSVEADMPQIHVSPAQGKLLHLLARMQGARRILEIGTLAGYSTIWLARALPAEGRLITLEVSEKHAAVAAANIARADLAHLVDIKLGPAIETLPTLDGQAPFDLIFIDADKPNIPGYFVWAIRLSRPGTLILVDNVVRRGALADPDNPDPAVQAVRRFLDQLAADKRVTATAIQTVGCKGYDGLAIVLVL